MSIQQIVEYLVTLCQKPTGQAGFGWCVRQVNHTGKCWHGKWGKPHG